MLDKCISIISRWPFPEEAPETLAIHEHGCVCTAILLLVFFLFFFLQSRITNAKTNSVLCGLSIYNLISEVKATTEEFKINMWRKMCHVLSVKIVYVVRLRHSEHRETPKIGFLPTKRKKKKKIGVESIPKLLIWSNCVYSKK